MKQDARPGNIPLEAALEQSLRENRRALIQTVHAVTAVAARRDRYTALHQRRVATLALAIGKQLALEPQQLEGLYLGALVHDIGKIAIPSELLSKPSQLTAQEYALVQTHVLAGTEMLETVVFPWPIHAIIAQHHERLDGSGYPHALSGDGIILEARITAVADVFEAMTEHRPYRRALAFKAVLQELTQGAGVKFDQDVVGALRTVVNGHTRPDLWAQLEADDSFTSTAVLPALTLGRRP